MPKTPDGGWVLDDRDIVPPKPEHEKEPKKKPKDTRL